MRSARPWAIVGLLGAACGAHGTDAGVTDAARPVADAAPPAVDAARGSDVEISTDSSAAPDAGAIACRVAGDGRTTLTFVNACATPITYAGSNGVQGMLAPGAFRCVDLGSDTATLSALRYWGYRDVDPGNEHRSLAEFTLNTSFHALDFYDISFVDAFNLPMQIVPVAMPSCHTRTCAQDLVPGCPAVGRYDDAAGALIACVSPDRNNGTSPVAQYFHAGCTDAYSWSGDNAATTGCAGEDYDVVFCPPAP